MVNTAKVEGVGCDTWLRWDVVKGGMMMRKGSRGAMVMVVVAEEEEACW